MNLLAPFRKPDPIDVSWHSAPPNADTTANLKAECRRLLTADVEAGKLKPTTAAAVNARLRDEPVKALARLLRKLADDAAAGVDVAAQSERIAELLKAGKAGALFRLAEERRALAEAFEASGYSERLRDLKAKRDSALAAWNAVKDCEDTTDQKKRRLHGEYLATTGPLNELSNSRDDELLAFKRAMKETGDSSLGRVTDWRNFAI